MILGEYNDNFEDFTCEILACSLNGEKYLIRDIEENELGWCSAHLVSEDE